MCYFYHPIIELQTFKVITWRLLTFIMTVRGVTNIKRYNQQQLDEQNGYLKGVCDHNEMDQKCAYVEQIPKLQFHIQKKTNIFVSEKSMVVEVWRVNQLGEAGSN